MVSLSAIDANYEKKWKGFYDFLSMGELQEELDEYWNITKHKQWEGRYFSCFL